MAFPADSALRALPAAPPFSLRARVLTPLEDGTTLYLDDARIDVDSRGRIAGLSACGANDTAAGGAADVAGALPATAWGPLHDIRPWLVLPGLIDLHVHIPQLPNAGVGDGLDLLSWLDRYTLPLERRFDRATAERRAPLAFAAMAAAGTTTVVGYVTTDPGATEATFEAAEAHGIRAILGHVLMDRPMGEGAHHGVAETADALAASAALCDRWHGRDGGRLRYAFTPRFAVSCTSELLEGSVRLARDAGAHWQTHLSEDVRELEEVQRSFLAARDYLDVYEMAGALELGPKALFAHAIHLSRREIERLAVSGAGIAHCPASNLFLPSGIMPLARYLDAGLRVGLGSDVSGGPSLSIFEVMRVGAYADTALRTTSETFDDDARPRPAPFDWLRLGTLDGARALGLSDVTGSIEAGKEADLIAVDPALTEPVPGDGAADDPAELLSRLIFRTHPDMVRASWVRGRRLASRAGPDAGPEPSGASPGTNRHLDAPAKATTPSAERRPTASRRSHE